MYIVIWEFRARGRQMRQFEDVYGPRGAWAALFGKSAGYLGTELLTDARDGGRYVTIDRWESLEACESFARANRHTYEELDQRFEALTEEERLLGAFEARPAAASKASASLPKPGRSRPPAGSRKRAAR